MFCLEFDVVVGVVVVPVVDVVQGAAAETEPFHRKRFYYFR